jgi:glutaconate CoA-transferase subunit A
MTLNRKSKLVALEDVFADAFDGMSVIAAGAHFNNVPMALVRQLMRKKLKELVIIPTPATGFWVDMMVAAGQVSKIYVSFIGLEVFGLAPNFRRAAEAKEIDIVEVDEPTIFHGLRAAGSGLPFVAFPPIHLLGDLPRVSPEMYKSIEDPFTGQTVVAVPPLSPDVALLHFAKSDEYGNAVSLGGRHMEDVIAKSAKRVVISAEEIVSNEEISSTPMQTILPGVLVDAVVHAPLGAHPGACPGVYGHDRPHLEEYNALAQQNLTSQYLEKLVFDPSGEAAIMDAMSKERLEAVSAMNKSRKWETL